MEYSFPSCMHHLQIYHFLVGWPPWDWKIGYSYIHPGYIVLILKILKKNVVNSLSVKTRNALVKFFFHIWGSCVLSHDIHIYCHNLWFYCVFFFKILFQCSKWQYTDKETTWITFISITQFLIFTAILYIFEQVNSKITIFKLSFYLI